MEDKVNSTIYYGEVIWFSSSKGFGFIQWSVENQAQRDLFVHWSDIEAKGFKTLFKGQKVSFNLGKNHNGDPKAIKIEIILN